MEMNEFNWSSKRTIGMEIEFQLVDFKTLDLANVILPLMEHYSDNIYIKPEFIQCSVEVMSKICQNVQELEWNLRSLVCDLHKQCKDLGIKLSGAGTHPFHNNLAVITPIPRYLGIENRVGYACYNYITFSMHVHVGMSSGEEMIALMNRLRPYIPVLLALSASSPFWRGHDTGHVSYRHRVLAPARTYGLPPLFKNWEKFCTFFKAARYAGIYDTFRDYHWDLRPRPDFGTLEIRMMDTQPTVGEAISLAAFSQSLIEYLKFYSEEAEENLLSPLPHWIELENRYRASQHGLDAMYVEDESGNSRPIRNIVEDILASITEIASRLGVSQQLTGISKVLSNGPSYIRQQYIYKETGSYKAVVSSVLGELEAEIKEASQISAGL